MSNNNDREMDSLFFYILAGDVWSREGIESGSRQLFVLDQSWSSSSPVDLFIPASLLNKSSLKPSIFESLSSSLGGYT